MLGYELFNSPSDKDDGGDHDICVVPEYRKLKINNKFLMIMLVPISVEKLVEQDIIINTRSD